MLSSLRRQTLFEELPKRGLTLEIICVANACTDRTAEIARHCFDEKFATHPGANAIRCRVIEVPERGKLNAWNRFVHQFSASTATTLFLMDGDIVLQEPETLWNMFSTLRAHPSVAVTVDRPVKDISLEPVKGLRRRLSLAFSRVTHSAPAQMSGQLYAIRAEVARNLYLPRDLGSCDDGFIKAMVCTDCLTHPVVPGRIMAVPNASHLFAAYLSFGDLLRNQQRQAIGQTVVHILVDGFLKTLPATERLRMGETLRRYDETDPTWLKRLVADHLRRTRYFWKLYPDALDGRYRRWKRLPSRQRLACFPAMVAGTLLGIVAIWRAHRALWRGHLAYWPETHSPQLDRLATSLSR